LTSAPTGELDTGHLATSIRISSLPLSEDLAKLMVKPLSASSKTATFLSASSLLVAILPATSRFSFFQAKRISLILLDSNIMNFLRFILLDPKWVNFIPLFFRGSVFDRSWGEKSVCRLIRFLV
jgi:hypothetical protein